MTTRKRPGAARRTVTRREAARTAAREKGARAGKRARPGESAPQRSARKEAAAEAALRAAEEAAAMRGAEVEPAEPAHEPSVEASEARDTGPSGDAQTQLGPAVANLARSALSLARTVIGAPFRLALAIPMMALRAIDERVARASRATARP